MRLKNIYVICRDCIDNVEAINGKTSSTNSGYTNVAGWGDFLKVYTQLSDMKYTKEAINELVNSVPEIYRHKASFSVTNAEWNKIAHARNKLVNSMADVIFLYESMGLSDGGKIGLDIKLPECVEFSEFKKCIDELDFILYKCPLFKIEGEELRFGRLDVGSSWLELIIECAGIGVIGVTGSMLLNNVLAFISKCIVIRSQCITVKQQKAQLHLMEMEVKEKEKAMELIDKIYTAQVDKYISELEEETGVELKNGEERGLVSLAFERTNALLDKGLEIYASIESPQEIKKLYEPLKMKYLSISEEVKLLEGSNSEE